MLMPQETTRFRRDLRRVRRRGKDLEKIRAAIRILVAEEPLPERMRDHPLVGDWRGYRECHIEPDWLLIYRTDPEAGTLTLVRTGTPCRPVRYLLVSALFQGSVEVFATQSLELVKRIEVGGGPLGVLITPDGRTAYVAQPQENRVTAVNLSTWDVLIHFPSQQRPDGMAYLAPPPP